MNQENLHERIEVETTFVKGNVRCIPKSFLRSNGREIIITEVGLVHPKYDGLRTNYAFDVTDGQADYRLVFETERLTWYLEWMGDYE
ncbi:hypothetical protein IKG54_00720 [Candidatus Saccharibacteria bacterium]|nr:hypothetical protein [Candidatus Saccharibacteria bacterium]